MEENLNAAKRMHKATLVNRKNCNLTGVSDVLSFDENEVLLETEAGMLMIKGKELHVNRLTLEKGEIDVEGRMDSFTYSEQVGNGSKTESVFARLFR